MTNYGSYYGIPVYLGNLEFPGKEPIEVAVRYWGTEWLFNVFALIEWVFTPPNAGSLFFVGGLIDES